MDINRNIEEARKIIAALLGIPEAEVTDDTSLGENDVSVQIDVGIATGTPLELNEEPVAGDVFRQMQSKRPTSLWHQRAQE